MSYEQVCQFIQEHPTLLATTALASVTAAATLWMTSVPDKPIEFPISLDNQSFEIEPGVRTSWFAKDGKLAEYYYDDVKTTHEALLRGIRVSNNGPCLGTREKTSKEYKWISYQQVYDQAHRIGSAFVSKGLKPQDTTFIGIYAPNCPQWAISAEACAMFSMALVPLYDTLGASACEYIINQTEMELVVCDDGPKAKLLIQSAGNMPSLKTLLVIHGNSLNNDIIEAGRQANIEVITYDDMLKFGENNLQKLVPAKPETISTISYTSGTTGNPKGVIINHKGMVCNISACIWHNNKLFEIDSNDYHLAYLPLAHMFERLNQLMMIMQGAKIGFNCGDIRLILDDLAILRPTVFPTVPRLLNRIYDKVQQSLASKPWKKALFDYAVKRKMDLLKKGIITKNTIWDRLVFARIQNLLGGRIRACCTGSAPCSVSVLNFIRASFGCYVFEGYGQTEVTAAVTMTLPQETAAGVVGPPVPCCHIKLDDIPEMDYFAKDGKGEICVKSSCNMVGYYKEPEKTKEALSEDGWVHTGDVGMWLPNGCLKIIDRRKHIFKLAQGEYIAPEKIEDIYIRSPFVAQVFVDGDSLQPFPLAVVVPEEEVLPSWAKKELNLQGSMEELCQNKLVKKAILDDLTKRGREAGLKGFELVKDIYLTPNLFTVEDGLLTPTLKSKRPALRKKFEPQLQDMYNQNA